MSKATFFALSVLLCVISLRGEIRLKTKSFKCNASNKSVEPTYKCYAKSYSRNYSTINYSFNFSSPKRNTMVNKKKLFPLYSFPVHSLYCILVIKIFLHITTPWSTQRLMSVASSMEFLETLPLNGWSTFSTLHCLVVCFALVLTAILRLTTWPWTTLFYSQDFLQEAIADP